MNGFRIFWVALLVLAASASASDFWTPPEVDPLADDLTVIPASELQRTRQQYETLLKKYRAKAATIPDADRQYLSLQHEYDIARLKIADVLPGMIERYE